MKIETKDEKKKIKGFEPNGFYLWGKDNLPPALTSEESIKLLKQYKTYGDLDVRDKLVNGSLRLVAYFVLHFGRNFVNKLTSIEPSIEDLCQQSVIYLYRAIENYNPDYKFTFATYLQHALYRGFARYTRKPDTKLKLEDKITMGGKYSDDEGCEIQDFVPDTRVNIEKDVTERYDVALIKNKILPILPSREREIFMKIAIDGQSFENVGQMYNVSREFMRQKYDKVLSKVSKMFLKGVSEADKLLSGTIVDTFVRRRVEKNIAILKKYDNEYLKVYFPARLKDKEKQMYFGVILNYYGQTVEDLKKNYNCLERDVFRIIKKLDEKIELLYPTYLKEQGKFVKEKQHRLSTEQKTNVNERLLNEYGGKYFLYKYFTKTLAPQEQKVFKVGMLEYDGESQEELAKKCSMNKSTFSNTLANVRTKLQSTDFELVVQMVDRAETKGISISNMNLESQERTKQRLELVNKYGGKENLRKYFLPTLTDNQKLIFEKMYLDPQVATYDDLTKISKTSIAYAIVAEKVVLEKLKNFNLEEMKQIRDNAKNHYSQIKSKNRSLGQRGHLLYRRYENVQNMGGREFLEEKFIPTLLTEADKIIFRGYYIDYKSEKEILKDIGLKKEYRGYINGVMIQRINPKFKQFKESFENFEEAVVDFYAKKGYEKNHNDNYERILFERENEKLKSKEDMRHEYSELIERCGGEKILINKFMPTLKTATKQIIFVDCILNQKKDSVVAKKVGLDNQMFKYEKNSVVKSLETFASKNEKKKD